MGNYYIANILWACRSKYKKIINLKGTKIISESKLLKFKKDFIGKNNIIRIGKHCVIHNLKIKIRGSNNSIDIGSDCHIGKNCSLWIEGNNCNIIIGNNLSITHTCQICVQENNQSVKIGDDCMLSNNIIIRTSDSHPIYDLSTKDRVNDPQSVVIGNHVWIAPNCKIMKGAQILDGSIIGSDTTINKVVPPNSLAVGRPCKIVRENVSWSREKLF